VGGDDFDYINKTCIFALVNNRTMVTVKISALSALRAIQHKMKGKGESVGFNTPDDVAAYIRNMRKQANSSEQCAF
jgi:hypothetical protein